MAEIALATVERILRNAGAGRVGNDASEALREVLEDYASSVASKAVKLAEHAGRKTVKAGDVKLAK